MEIKMRKLLKKCFIAITLSSILAISSLLTIPTYAKDPGPEIPVDETTTTDYSSCPRQFLGLPSWDCGINTNPQSEEDLKKNIKIIADNILTIISGLATYLLIGYVIYGGYLYIFSSGDPSKTSAGKKTLTNAFIGLAIAVFANIIFRSISIALVGNSNLTMCTTATADCEYTIINNVIDWVIGVSGAVAAIYVVIGGIGYITSSGDPAKLQKSRNTIIYALIGLVIVAFSIAIHNFVAGAINSANNGEDISGPIVNLLNFVIGFSGVVSVVYVLKGGIDYMTSAGDPGKLKKAKDTILYACIGLIVCALSFALVNWAIGTINKADESPTTSQNITTKKLLHFS